MVGEDAQEVTAHIQAGHVQENQILVDVQHDSQVINSLAVQFIKVLAALLAGPYLELDDTLIVHECVEQGAEAADADRVVHQIKRNQRRQWIHVKCNCDGVDAFVLKLIQAQIISREIAVVADEVGDGLGRDRSSLLIANSELAFGALFEDVGAELVILCLCWRNVEVLALGVV